MIEKPLPGPAPGRSCFPGGKPAPPPASAFEVPRIGILERLFVSDSSVRTHLRGINQKLHATGRIEAVVIARRLGLIV